MTTPERKLTPATGDNVLATIGLGGRVWLTQVGLLVQITFHLLALCVVTLFPLGALGRALRRRAADMEAP